MLIIRTTQENLSKSRRHLKFCIGFGALDARVGVLDHLGGGGQEFCLRVFASSGLAGIESDRNSYALALRRVMFVSLFSERGSYDRLLVGLVMFFGKGQRVIKERPPKTCLHMGCSENYGALLDIENFATPAI